jgi:hypothetical protein
MFTNIKAHNEALFKNTNPTKSFTLYDHSLTYENSHLSVTIYVQKVKMDMPHLYQLATTRVIGVQGNPTP